MELGSCDDLGQLLHIGGLYINDIEALILDVQIPEVDAQIVAADVRLAVAVDGDAVDVVGMGISIGPSGDGSDNGIVVRQSREPQVGRILEMCCWRWAGSTSSTSNIGGGYIMGEIVLGNNLERLFKDLPKLDCLVVC